MSLFDGLPPPVVVDSSEFEQERQRMLDFVPEDARYRFRLHKIQTNAAIAMMKSSSSFDSSPRTSVLQPLVEIYDDQLTELKPEAFHPMSEFVAAFLACGTYNN